MNGQFPQAGPAMPQPQQQGFASQVPPEYQGRIDPNSPIQKMLLDRIGSLGPEDLAALDRIPDQAAAVLKRILPEIDFIIDQITKDSDMQEMAEGEGAEQPAPPMQQGRPMSRLGQIG